MQSDKGAQKTPTCIYSTYLQQGFQNTQLGKIISSMNDVKAGWKRIKLNSYFMPYMKISSKWPEDLNIWLGNCKNPRQNIREIFWMLVLDNDFFGYDTKNMDRKAKIGNIKLKRLCTAKEKNNSTNKQPVKWEKIFSNHTCDNF